MRTAGLRHEPALRFWLRYAEREGALVEDSGDQALVLLPDALREASEMGEEVSVTSDPDVAREDGAVLLIPGHPALDRAAQAVLADGDAGSLHLPWPGSRRPLSGTLEARARELVAVAHGRIDASGEIAAAYLPLLRVGAMVSYAASLTLRFQEQEETWIDARSGLLVADRVLEALADRPRLREPDARHRALAADLPLALSGAHEQLEQRARSRRDALRAQARRALESELARADAYYEGALESIERRRASAPDERLRLLDARADATRAEHARRRREIEEEFEARYELRPFRLHLVHVPAYVLPVHVRRGSRRFPFELAWIAGTGQFAPVRCPACGGTDELVAGRERLGCATCTPGAAVRPLRPAPRADARRPESQSRGSAGARPDGTAEESARPRSAETAETPVRPKSAGRGQPPKVARRGGAAPPPSRSAARPGAKKTTARTLERTGNKLALAFWQGVAEGGRWPRKKIVRHSPLAVLYRLYGQAAPVCALGIPPRQWPSEVTATTYPTQSTDPELTVGELVVAGSTYTYALFWWLEAGKPIVAEVMPAPHPAVLRPPRHGSPETEARLYECAPPPAAELDPVAAVLWEAELADAGLPVAVRCLATWWRVHEVAAPDEPRPALAAAVSIAVARAAGMPRRKDEVAERYETTAAALERATRALGARLRLDRRRGW